MANKRPLRVSWTSIPRTVGLLFEWITGSWVIILAILRPQYKTSFLLLEKCLVSDKRLDVLKIHMNHWISRTCILRSWLVIILWSVLALYKSLRYCWHRRFSVVPVATTSKLLFRIGVLSTADLTVWKPELYLWNNAQCNNAIQYQVTAPLVCVKSGSWIVNVFRMRIEVNTWKNCKTLTIQKLQFCFVRAFHIKMFSVYHNKVV